MKPNNFPTSPLFLLLLRDARVSLRVCTEKDERAFERIDLMVLKSTNAPSVGKERMKKSKNPRPFFPSLESLCSAADWFVRRPMLWRGCPRGITASVINFVASSPISTHSRLSLRVDQLTRSIQSVAGHR